MDSQRTKLTVGLFMFVGLCIALLAFIWLGMSNYLEKGHLYSIYFEESVQGLEKDSPVKYRGVDIGRVVKLAVAPDSKLIEAIVKIDREHRLEKNIVAQLTNAGITGIMFIELDLKEPEEEDKSPGLSFKSDYEIIPSKPSNITEILEGIDDLFDQIRSIDLETISGKIKTTLDKVNQAIDDANIKGLSASFETSLESIEHIVEKEKWDRILSSVEDSVTTLKSALIQADRGIGKFDNTIGTFERLVAGKEKHLEEAIDDFKMAIDKVNKILDDGDSIVAGADESIYLLARNLMTITKNLEEATDNINRISGIIADHPSQLLFGEPPPEKKIEE